MPEKNKRIWEVDALRGFLILCVVAAHSLYFGAFVLERFTLPDWITFVITEGGVLFVLLSGLSATLGSRSFRRGIFVFCGGMVLTLGSLVAVLLGWLDEGMLIRFGVLHFLGFAMMLYPLLRPLPSWLLLVLALVLLALGYWFRTFYVSTPLLFPLGLRTKGFTSGDYFPIAPQLGWFQLGIVLGRTLYPTRKSLLPKVDPETPVLRFFCFCGRNSLYIFLLHLPLVGAIMMLI